jgi:hypothetical protein
VVKARPLMQVKTVVFKPDIVGVHLVVDVLARVHVEARVQERAIAQGLFRVRLKFFYIFLK